MIFFPRLLFILAGGLAILSAFLVISQKKVIYSALYLALHFLSLAILYVLLAAPFVALMQILIYAGAIMVLFLFVIMLMGPDPDLLRGNRWQRGLGWLLVTSLFFLLGWGILSKPGSFMAKANLPETYGGIRQIGMLLFSKYLLLFELVSILLLVAMLGVVVMGRKKGGEEESS